MAQTQRTVLVIADGDVDVAQLVSLVDRDERPFVIAADGGAGKALLAGVLPDLVIGDGDSLLADERARLEAMGAELRGADPDKDESDTELCLLAALATDAQRITLLGALGGERPEHAVANLLLLADPRLDGRVVEIVDGAARLTRIGREDGPGSLSISGAPGDYVSLFPLGADVEGIRTDGLRFRLDGEALRLGPSRGLSNELLDDQATVTTERGRLLVVHTARRQA
jgi:thiamine pyrophosphokinase